MTDKKLYRLNVRLSEEDHWLLFELARIKNVSTSELLRDWIRRVSKHEGIVYSHEPKDN